MLNAIDYTSKVISLYFGMTMFATGLYEALNNLGVTDKDSHLTEGGCWFAMYFVLPDDLKKKVDEAVKAALKEYEERLADKS